VIANDASTEAQGCLRNPLRRVEADILVRAIREVGGDRKLAAQKLGIGLSSLYRKLDELERKGVVPSSENDP
jgi:two-component system response regulator AtoC